MAIGLVPYDSSFDKGWYSVSPPDQVPAVDRLPDDCVHLTWEYQLPKDQVETVARLVAGRPDVLLKVFRRGASDLSWLAAFQGHRRFEIFLNRDTDGRQLELMPDSVTWLTIRGWGERADLNSLSHLLNLEVAMFDGVQKGFESLADLKRLQRLLIRGAKKLDASFLAGLPKLWSLDFKLGSMANPEEVGQCRNLRYLELWASWGLNNLDFVSCLESLQFLFLEELHRVTNLPDMSRLHNLRRLYVHRMRSITSIAQAARAPALEEIAVINCDGLGPDDLSVLAQSGTLKRALVGSTSLGRTRALEQACPIPIDRFSKWDFEYR